MKSLKLNLTYRYTCFLPASQRSRIINPRIRLANLFTFIFFLPRGPGNESCSFVRLSNRKPFYFLTLKYAVFELNSIDFSFN